MAVDFNEIFLHFITILIVIQIVFIPFMSMALYNIRSLRKAIMIIEKDIKYGRVTYSNDDYITICTVTVKIVLDNKKKRIYVYRAGSKHKYYPTMFTNIVNIVPYFRKVEIGLYDTLYDMSNKK